MKPEKHKDPMMYRSIARKKLLKRLLAWAEAIGEETPTDEKKGELKAMLETNKDYDLRIKEEEWNPQGYRYNL